MTRLRERDWRFKGEITAFLSLIFLLMLSVVAATFTSASVQVKKSSQRAKMRMALESVFAEYNTELLEQYDLFARAGCDEGIIDERLEFYGMTDVQQKVTKQTLLTDDGGLPYYQQAVGYVKNWLGLESGMGGENSSGFEADSSLEILEEENESQLAELLEEAEATLPEEGNPLKNIQNLKRSGLLSILVENSEDLSHRSIETDNLPSRRTLHVGKGEFENKAGEGGISEKTLFLTYLFEHFSDASEERNLRALSYELEYILCGNAVDSENLEETLKKIQKIRMGINYAYLQTDEVKKAEAGAVAVGLCSLIQIPGIVSLVKQAVLLAWAYGESIVDLKVLMRQDRVPLWKNADTWQLQLSNLAKLGTKEEISGAKRYEEGLNYQDYLKGLLLLERRESLCMRSLDLIESNLSVRVDECMTRIEMESSYRLKDEIYDRFRTEFGYQ